MTQEEQSVQQAEVGFDTEMMVRGVAAPFLAWGAAVGLISWSGNAGVVCVTPMAWLMGLWVGTFIAGRSRSLPSRRRIEALICGGVLGFLQGILFYIVSSVAMPVQPDEVQNAFVISLGIIVFGTIVSALLSLLTASMRNRQLPS